jgi:hypothetical protein
MIVFPLMIPTCALFAYKLNLLGAYFIKGERLPEDIHRYDPLNAVLLVSAIVGYFFVNRKLRNDGQEETLLLEEIILRVMGDETAHFNDHLRKLRNLWLIWCGLVFSLFFGTFLLFV